MVSNIQGTYSFWKTLWKFLQKVYIYIECVCPHLHVSVLIAVHIMPFNPIALRKAKIVCNFGLSGCNRVTQQ